MVQRPREHIKNYGKQVMPVRTLEGIRTQEHVADVRRLLVSASHIIQAGSDSSIGKKRGVHHEQEEEREITAQEAGERVRS